jgi:hypothetical protein
MWKTAGQLLHAMRLSTAAAAMPAAALLLGWASSRWQYTQWVQLRSTLLHSMAKSCKEDSGKSTNSSK